jgi:hypothetical protein
MHQLAQATRQTVADLAQRVGMGQLAEQHRNQLRSATEPFAARSALCFFTSAANSSFGKCCSS